MRTFDELYKGACKAIDSYRVQLKTFYRDRHIDRVLMLQDLETGECPIVILTSGDVLYPRSCYVILAVFDTWRKVPSADEVRNSIRDRLELCFAEETPLSEVVE